MALVLLFITLSAGCIHAQNDNCDQQQQQVNNACNSFLSCYNYKIDTDGTFYDGTLLFTECSKECHTQLNAITSECDTVKTSSIVNLCLQSSSQGGTGVNCEDIGIFDYCKNAAWKQPQGQTCSESRLPTSEPTPDPTSEPTFAPDSTPDPTPRPTSKPTIRPTLRPTPEPTLQPTPDPTPMPTLDITPTPMFDPTPEPTSALDFTPEPTFAPDPTPKPTSKTMSKPTPILTAMPTSDYTFKLTFKPTTISTFNSTLKPTPTPENFVHTSSPSALSNSSVKPILSYIVICVVTMLLL